MRRKHIKRVTALFLAALLVFSFCGCNRSGNTIDEPDVITTEYLYGDYAEQLIRDGAEVTLGTVSLESTGTDTYNIIVESMVIVESDITDQGYYIADKNLSSTAPLDPAARIAYISEPGAEAEVITVDEFAEIVTAENYDPLKEGAEQIYDIYSISGSVVMVLAKELPVTE